MGPHSKYRVHAPGWCYVPALLFHYIPLVKHVQDYLPILWVKALGDLADPLVRGHSVVGPGFELGCLSLIPMNLTKLLTVKQK